MSLPEIVWRVGQKRLQKSEDERFAHKVSVCDDYFYGDVKSLNPNWDLLGLNFSNKQCTVGNSIELLGDYRYEDYKNRWHAGFQTDREWPLIPSSKIDAGADGVPGDLRTNWELNRHYQFALLAKSYFVSQDAVFLDELVELFDDWNKRNPFLWGPEWTSAMELGIRLINWSVTAAFLLEMQPENPVVSGLLGKITIGCANMAEYVRQHRSRYSSANNHAIVEAAALGIAGFVYANENWGKAAFGVLDCELARQTHPDGVNKEQALHYQTFGMEAYALYLHVRKRSGEVIPKSWTNILAKECDYIRDCRISKGVYLEFGDDDEGIILNLATSRPCHFEYVLSLLSFELDSAVRWSEELESIETVVWLYTEKEIESCLDKQLKEIGDTVTYPDGGVTIFRTNDFRVTVGVDHGPLGLEPLAAHGHADALSFQMFVDGEPVIIDPGTYIYNGDRKMRDWFRSTSAHNTVCINGKDQSEMLGPFLWGRKAKVCDFSCGGLSGEKCLTACHNGYMPKQVQRTFEFDGSKLVIFDRIHNSDACEAVSCLHFPYADAELNERTAKLHLKSGTTLLVDSSIPLKAGRFDWSPSYGMRAEGVVLSAPFHDELKMTISVA